MISKTVDVAEAHVHLLELLDDVEHGTAVFLRKDDRLVAEIIQPSRRIMGLHRGAIECSADFDAELPGDFWTSGK